MVLIPQETFHKLQSNVKTVNEQSNSVQTIGDKFTRLDSEMKKILDSETYNTEGDKYKHFLQFLQRYLFHVDDEKRSNIEKINTEMQGLEDNYILSSIPKLFQNKTKLLLNHLKNNSDRISWNEKGVVTIDNVKINNSNIIDILNDVARSRKNVRAIGREQFAELLSSTETPQEFIGNVEYLNNGFESLIRDSEEQSSSLDETVVENKKNKKQKITVTSTPIHTRTWKKLKLNENGKA